MHVAPRIEMRRLRELVARAGAGNELPQPRPLAEDNAIGLKPLSTAGSSASSAGRPRLSTSSRM
jgi:hypothetical protein